MITFAKCYFANTNILHDLLDFPHQLFLLRTVAYFSPKNIVTSYNAYYYNLFAILILYKLRY